MKTTEIIDADTVKVTMTEDVNVQFLRDQLATEQELFVDWESWVIGERKARQQRIDDMTAILTQVDTFVVAANQAADLAKIDS